LNDRPPLRLRVTVPGRGTFSLTVIVVHQRSFGGVDADVNEHDPDTALRVRAKRRAQSESLARLVQTRQDLNEDLVVLGDFNAYQFNDGYVDVLGTVRGQPAEPDQVVLASPDLVSPDLIDLIDIVTPDISVPLRENGAVIIEVNAGPGVRMHTHPTEGEPRNVAAPILDMLFPPGAPTTSPRSEP
jgi:hypothetical protein